MRAPAAPRTSLRTRLWLAWDSGAAQPVHASYRWRDARGHVIVHDGLRTLFPSAVREGDRIDLALAVQAPETDGESTLAIDLVQEGVAWFSDQGARATTVTIDVRQTLG